MCMNVGRMCGVMCVCGCPIVLTLLFLLRWSTGGYQVIIMLTLSLPDVNLLSFLVLSLLTDYRQRYAYLRQKCVYHYQ